MSRAALIGLLRDRLGLDPEVLGERVLDDAFAEARRTLGVNGDTALYSRAVADPGSFADVIEHFVVPETWFFRAPEQFKDLVRFARAHARARPCLRVLSLPCASGEEAYSAAMSLLDAGFSPEQFEVVGIDVSRKMVEYAQLGVYRRNAVRGDPLSTPWVTQRGQTFVIDPLVKRCVRFRVGNALEDGAFTPGERFDAVFCRNLLIYLHEAARARLLSLLCSVLNPPALILAGQAEVLPAMASGFAPWPNAESPLTYVFRGEGAREPRRDVAPRPAHESPPPLGAATRASAATPREAKPHGTPPKPAPTKPAERAPSAFEQARRLADLGQLDAAWEQCAAHLKQQPQDVEALYLLGLIESARGNIAAADAAFGQVLYLDGEHVEALEHRIALAQRQGNAVEVRKLRARAQRLELKRRSRS